MPADTADAIAEEYADARLRGLRAALSVLALIALIALLFTRRLPDAAAGASADVASPTSPTDHAR